jgi:hypothetical protein
VLWLHASCLQSPARDYDAHQTVPPVQSDTVFEATHPGGLTIEISKIVAIDWRRYARITLEIEGFLRVAVDQLGRGASHAKAGLWLEARSADGESALVDCYADVKHPYTQGADDYIPGRKHIAKYETLTPYNRRDWIVRLSCLASSKEDRTVELVAGYTHTRPAKADKSVPYRVFMGEIRSAPVRVTLPRGDDSKPDEP